MRILAMTPWGSMIGGANRSFLMVIKSLKINYGNTITVVVPNEGELTDELNKLDIPYVLIKAYNSGIKKKKDKKNIARLFKVLYYDLKNRQIALKTRTLFKDYDLIYLNSASLFFGYYLSKILKIPCIWHFRGFITKDNIYSINQRKKYNDDNCKIIVISSDMKNEIPQSLGINAEKLILINNGLEISKLPPIVHNSSHFHCLICGRITRWKCQHDAIIAANIIISSGYNFTLHVVGDANSEDDKEYYQELTELVAKFKLEDKVIFHGQVSNVNHLRDKMDIELNCSLREPFGRTTIEGMQRGLVVIGSNTGGTLDIISNGINGLLYEQGNPCDLANKIVFLLDNPNEMNRISNEAYLFAKKHFTQEENVSKINKVLMESLL